MTINPVELMKQRYERKNNDEAAMKILAPNLNVTKAPVLTDLC